MRRFILRSLLGAAGTWLAATIVPAVETDGVLLTFVLMGLFIGVGEVVLFVTQQGTTIILFFIPGALRTFLLRMAVVTIAAGLVEGFTFSSPVLVGLVGTTVLISLLFLFPFAS